VANNRDGGTIQNQNIRLFPVACDNDCGSFFGAYSIVSSTLRQRLWLFFRATVVIANTTTGLAPEWPITEMEVQSKYSIVSSILRHLLWFRIRIQPLSAQCHRLYVFAISNSASSIYISVSSLFGHSTDVGVGRLGRTVSPGWERLDTIFVRCIGSFLSMFKFYRQKFLVKDLLPALPPSAH
jgi:hypothetical protein